ncbi:toxin-antitoxin system HicB family antitoxin, partial [Paracoccus sp. PAR01]|uniref:toxin-antitoxin system HicB family antitoxin n=1 Tax=Paracoccus sp. PAR01 TaxID=2769282 RepID=UPI00177FF551
GKEPLKPYSGKVMFRLRPETHCNIARAAELAGKSLNQWADEALERAAALAENPPVANNGKAMQACSSINQPPSD